MQQADNNKLKERRLLSAALCYSLYVIIWFGIAVISSQELHKEANKFNLHSNNCNSTNVTYAIKYDNNINKLYVVDGVIEYIDQHMKYHKFRAIYGEFSSQEKANQKIEQYSNLIYCYTDGEIMYVKNKSNKGTIAVISFITVLTWIMAIGFIITSFTSWKNYIKEINNNNVEYSNLPI